ncbi:MULTISPECIES: hypothetical protein [Sphingobacterium]|jgi:hypothetical protein|uniref:Uncharacterized protein n=2 Tax=Sphingobacterium TaxID=28453 RepID=A0ACD5C382_9SPHI|nr:MULTISPECIES: hypothetical protein [Sphingobacterium]QQT45773.1 hypothetical protein I6J00_03595 [Sphingobacterium multivorum]QQT61583.1 hypothetical protein I6I97_20695 [Sphingobacterium multivorum]SUJ28698.1 Uncharacterised protein [Sphingobacterium multivorum]VXD05620.1 conserved hypothetical protein [Sphingobacterium multivorum]
MATIYVITGPPYIGKSTCGQYFIPEGIKILDPNLFVQSYAELGLKDGYRRFEEQLLGLLSHDEDFAVEVNIVNKVHLQMLQDIKALYPENKIEMIFFYTDNMYICQARSKAKKNSSCDSDPDKITRSYIHTMPLVKRHLNLFSSVKGVDISENHIVPETVFKYQDNALGIEVSTSLPVWAQ